MEELLIDCSPGVSGDMLLGAFYDLGVPEKIIEQPLINLGLGNLYLKRGTMYFNSYKTLKNSLILLNISTINIKKLFIL